MKIEISRRVSLKVLTLSLLALSSACGFISMPDKMDQTNSNLADTLKKMDDTNAKMAAVTEGVRQQSMAAGLNNLFIPENTTYTNPFPLGMIPWAQLFAINAKESEFVPLMYVYMQYINESLPNDSLKDPQTGKWPASLVTSVDHDKSIRFNAVMAISGQVPQSLMKETVDTEITKGGTYNDTVLVILEARSMFIHDILLEGQLLANPDTPKKLSDAVEQAHNLDYIVALPFAATIGVQTHGMLDPNDEISSQLDPKISVAEWVKIDQAFDNGLQQQYKDAMKVPSNSVGVKLVTLRNEVHSACQALGIWDGKKCVEK